MYYAERILKISLKCLNNGRDYDKVVVIHIYCKSKSLLNDKVFDNEEYLSLWNTLAGDYINRVIKNTPTLENIAYFVCDFIDTCYKVEVEDEHEKVWYEKIDQ